MDTAWWSEMETPIDELPFNKAFSTFSPPPPSSIISNNYSYCHSGSAKNHLENMKVKSEVPSGTTINFSSSSSMETDDFGDSQSLIQALGFTFGAADTNTTTQKKTLSTLIPNLKKLDKATVLGDAIKYIKQLEEQLKTLEEKTKKCKEVEQVVAVKRPRLASSCDDSSSSGEISSVSTDRSLPDIEVRTSDGNILIRIYCKKQTGIMKEIFNEVDKLHLSVVSCSVMPFGYNTSHMTIIAQMDHKLSVTPNHIANRIRAVIMKEEASSGTT
ncbi:putative transcription factor bHLH25-like [Capsicum annuum]|nr:putative transcription factor bHLH25-like [Capsicum annuum]